MISPTAQSFHPFVAAACTLALIVCGAVRGDQVVVKDRNYAHAEIIDFDEGMLRFRSADGVVREAWIGEVELIAVEHGRGFVDFNEAERLLADGEPNKAVGRYLRTLRLSDRFWPDLVQVRVLLACDRAGRIDQAAKHFIAVMRSERAGPAVAAELIPQNLPARSDAMVARAVRQLDAAYAKSDPDHRILLAFFKYSLLGHGGDDAGAGELARTVAHRVIPETMRQATMYTIQLAALRRVLAGSPGSADLAALDRAIADCPSGLLPRMLLLKGNTLLRAASTREELIRAGWPFMRIAIHMPHDPLVADALYGTATVMEKLDRPDKAIGLLEECLARDGAAKGLRKRAGAALSRLRSPQ